MIVDAISYLGVYGAIAVMQNLEDESWGDRYFSFTRINITIL